MLPVREFFTEHGAALTHTEMISCAGLIRENAKTFDMLSVSEREAPLVVSCSQMTRMFWFRAVNKYSKGAGNSQRSG